MRIPALICSLVALNISPLYIVSGHIARELRIAYLIQRRYPSQKLRSAMLSAAMLQHRDAIARRANCSFSLKTLEVGNAGSRMLGSYFVRIPAQELPHVIISVKETLSMSVIRSMSQRCVMLAIDVVDRTELLNFSLAQTGGDLLPRVLLLVQTRASSRLLSLKREGLVSEHVIVPHQMTNLGAWRVRTPADAGHRKLRNMALLVGQAAKMPMAHDLHHLAVASCSVGVAFVVIFEHEGRFEESSLSHYECTNRSVALPPRVCIGAHCRLRTQLSRHQVNRNRHQDVRRPFGLPIADMPGFFSAGSQARFHDRPLIDEVDIAILWPNFRQADMVLHSPPTRLLFWWSHGVPCIFYPYVAYIDAAKHASYFLPAIAPFAKAFPVARTPHDVARLLGRLEAEPASRRALAAAGLRAVRDYAPDAIAARLVRGLCAHAADPMTSRCRK